MKRCSLVLFFVAFIAACGAAGRPRVVAPLSYAPLAALPDEAFRGQPPAAGPLVVTPPFGLWKAELSNGMGLVLVERRSLPIFSARLVVTRGARDLAERRGEVLELAMNALQREHEASVDAAPELRPTATCVPDGCALMVQGASGSFDAALAVLAKLAQKPGYGNHQLDRIKREWSNWAATIGGSGDDAATINTQQLLFPPHDAYAPTTLAERKLIADASIDAFAEVHAQLFQPRHVTLVVAGDIDQEAFRAAAERAFGGWAQSRPELPRTALAPAFPAAPGRTVLVDYPGVLVHAYLVARAPIGEDPDMRALSLLGALLSTPGGALSGEVRSSMGATYDVSAALQVGRMGSWWRIGGAFEPEKTLPAVAAMLNALRRARDQGIDPYEFEGARTRSIAGGRAQSGTVGGATSVLTSLLIWGLPPEAALTWAAKSGRLTAAEVQKAARDWLSDDALQLVVVGPRKHIAEGFDKLGIGKVEWRTRRGEAAK